MSLERQELSKDEVIGQAIALSAKLDTLTKKINAFKKKAKEFIIPPHLFLEVKTKPLQERTLALIALLPELEDLYKELLDIVNEKYKLMQDTNSMFTIKLFQEDEIKGQINKLVSIKDLEKNSKKLAKLFKPFSWEGPLGNILFPIHLCREERIIGGRSYYSDNEAGAKQYFTCVSYFIKSEDIPVHDKSTQVFLNKLVTNRAKAKDTLLTEVNKMEGFSKSFYKIYVDLYEALFKSQIIQSFHFDNRPR